MHHHNTGIEQEGKVEEGLGKSWVVFPRDKPLKWQIYDYFNCPDTLDSFYYYVYAKKIMLNYRGRNTSPIQETLNRKSIHALFVFGSFEAQVLCPK